MRPSAANIAAESVNCNDVDVEGLRAIWFVGVETVELDESKFSFLDGMSRFARLIFRFALEYVSNSSGQISACFLLGWGLRAAKASSRKNAHG